MEPKRWLVVPRVISRAKTEIMLIGCADSPPIKIDDFILKRTKKLICLGGDMTEDSSLDSDIKRIISRGAIGYHSLNARVWIMKAYLCQLKWQFTKPLSFHLYHKIMPVRHCPHFLIILSSLETFHQRSLRPILKIKWWHKKTNADVLGHAKTTTIETVIRNNRLRWLCHVCRMEDSRIPKRLLFNELDKGKMSRGQP